MDPGKTVGLSELAQPSEGSIVSRVLMKTDKGSVTLFAFDLNQALSEHTAPFDALVQVLEGSAEVTLGGKAHPVESGEAILMPAGVPHAVKALTPVKMLLTMIKA